MNNFTYSDKFHTPSSDIFYVVINSNIKNKEELFNSLSKTLNFPDYFGENWDAFEELLNDLSWIKEEKVMIAHSDVPNLSKEDLNAYLGILNDAIKSWKNDSVHELSVVFPENCESVVGNLLD